MITRDQKRALTGLATLLTIKAIVWLSIRQTSKMVRKKCAEYESTLPTA